MQKIIVEFDEELRDLRDLLAARHGRLVLVESCTAGLVCSLLGKIPGISQYLCGSMVVYRNDSKHQWLGIETAKLDDPNVGPVSGIVTQELAEAVLKRTPEATLVAAITGHLGPGAPSEFDGRIYICVHHRDSEQPYDTSEHRLSTAPAVDLDDWTARQFRQIEAARILILALRRSLK